MTLPSSRFRITRREFVSIATIYLSTLMGAVIGLPAIAYFISPALRARRVEAWVPLGPLQNYPIGSPTTCRFTRSQINGWEKTVSSYGVFVIRKDEIRVMVLSNICTHLACRVSWRPDLQHYVSPCHNGHFDITGNVISGPPPRPLDEFEMKIEDGNIYIKYPPYKRG